MYRTKKHTKYHMVPAVFVFSVLFSTSCIIASGNKVASVCTRPEHIVNWGTFISRIERLGIEVKDSDRLESNLADYKLIAIAVSTEELLQDRERLFEWVKNGGKLVTVFLNDKWSNAPFFPYEIHFSDSDPDGLEFVTSDNPIIKDLSNKKFAGLTSDVPVRFDEKNWHILGRSYTDNSPAILYADYGKGGILVLQLHLPLTRNINLMKPLVSNIVGWAGLETKKIAVSEDPFIRAADYAAFTAKPSLSFDWGEGVLMYGLLEAYNVTKKEEYLDTVRKWVDYNTRDGRLAKILEGMANIKGYCGHWGPGTPTVMLYEITGQDKYLKLTEDIWNFIKDTEKATRTDEGSLGHWRDNVQIWDDTLFMVCPTLAKYSAVSNDKKALEDAVLQLELAAKHLQCKWTHLFYHMWDSNDGTTNPCFWGRGNGWVIMSFVDVLEVLDKKSEDYAKLNKILNLQIKALVKYQTENGMWRTVVDRPDSYEETSATAMITYSIAKAMQLGLVKEDYKPVLRKAWKGLLKMVDEDGVVLGTSAGTGPSAFEVYNARPTGEYTWGTGSFLMAGARLKEAGIID